MGMPERTCVGCRQRKDKGWLLRFIADKNGHVRLDALKRASGRGAYVCPTLPCIKEATARAGLARGFRRNVAPVSPERLIVIAMQDVQDQARRMIGAALCDGRAQRVGVVEENEKELSWLGEGANVTVTEARLWQQLTGFAEQVFLLQADMQKPLNSSNRK